MKLFGLKIMHDEEPELVGTRVFLPKHLHKEMKMICARRDLSHRQYLQAIIIEAIMRDKKK